MKYLMRASLIAFLVTLIVSFLLVQIMGINIFSPFVFLIFFSVLLIGIGYIGQNKEFLNHLHLKVAVVIITISIISSIIICILLGQGCTLSANHITQMIGELLSSSIRLL